MGFHLAAGKAIKLIAPTASSVSIGSGSGRCGAGLIRRNWSVLCSRIRPPGPKLDAVFKAPALVAGAIPNLAAEKSAGPLIPEFFKSSPGNPNSTKKALTRQGDRVAADRTSNDHHQRMSVSVVACPRFEPTIRQVEFRRTIGGNIADLRRVGKSASALSLPNFYDFARLPSIFCDPLRSMVAPRQRERVNRPINSGENLGKSSACARSRVARETAQAGFA
jgi:hypothetical protein